MDDGWDEDEYSENRAIEKRVVAVLVEGLPVTPEDRRVLLALTLGPDVARQFDVNGADPDVARRLTVGLLQQGGRRGRRGLAALLEGLAVNAIREEWATEVTALVERLPRYRPAPVLIDETVADADPWVLAAQIREVVVQDSAPARVTSEALARLADGPADSFDDHIARCIADSERQPSVDERFVALSLLLDLRQDGIAQGPERFSVDRGRYDTLEAALDDNSDCELVLVGAPGAGKSTLCRRLRLELCRAHVQAEPDAALPFMVSLGEYGQDDDGVVPEPDVWLARQWAEAMPSVPFETALAQQRFVLLLDALNEMPREADATLTQRIEVWRSWLLRFHQRTEGRHRVVFTCRTRDLSASLSSKARSVRLLEIEGLDKKRVAEFLQEHAPDRAADILGRLDKDPQLADLYRTPLSLTLLLDLIRFCGDIPRTQAALFTGHLCHALHREVQRGNPRFTSSGLITEEDRAQLAQRAFDLADPYDLPDDGPLFGALAQLAFVMQQGHMNGERAHVSLKTKKARQLYETLPVSQIVDFGALVQAGADLGLISPVSGKVAFTRQPHQEYLAARWWAELAPGERPYDLVAPPWTDEERDLEAVVAGLKQDDPLPPPPSTAWEETVLMGAEMAEDDGVLDGIEAVHPALAGRAAARRSDGGRKARLRKVLFGTCRNPQVDLRVRIEAGQALGELGHPDLVVKTGKHGRYIEPPMVRIEGGTFTMGADDTGFSSDGPAHRRKVASFSLGRYPVTRAEFECFVDAGGYREERWWVGEAARRWFEGSGVGEGRKDLFRGHRQTILRNPKMLDGEQFTPPSRKFWRRQIERTDEEFEAFLDKEIESGRQTEPWGWNNPRYRNPAFSVIGVCHFEVEAYLTWLSTQTGRRYQLPDECQWERAARGLKPSKDFPWGGTLEPLRHANVYDSHIRGLTPVGAWPDGDSKEGCVELSGNVWEWTSSFWTERHKTTKGSDGPRRVVRGGSWSAPMTLARGASRNGAPLGYRNLDLGFRVCFPSPQSEV